MAGSGRTNIVFIKIKHMKKLLEKSRFDILAEKATEILYSAGWEDRLTGTFNPYELILECELSDVSNKVVLGVIEGKSWPQYMTEIKLGQKEIFVFDRWGLYLLNTTSYVDVAFDEHTFPDDHHFSPSESIEGEEFYKSKLKLIVNNQIVMPDVGTDRFRSAFTAEDRSLSAPSGLIGMETVAFLDGSKNIRFELDLP